MFLASWAPILNSLFVVVVGCSSHGGLLRPWWKEFNPEKLPSATFSDAISTTPLTCMSFSHFTQSYTVLVLQLIITSTTMALCFKLDSISHHSIWPIKQTQQSCQEGKSGHFLETCIMVLLISQFSTAAIAPKYEQKTYV
jgi:hypothetical protein